MDAAFLQPGDTFAEMPPADYTALNDRQRQTVKTTTVREVGGPCATAPDRLHMVTTRGTWCIPAATPVTLLD